MLADFNWQPISRKNQHRIEFESCAIDFTEKSQFDFRQQCGNHGILLSLKKMKIAYSVIQCSVR